VSICGSTMRQAPWTATEEMLNIHRCSFPSRVTVGRGCRGTAHSYITDLLVLAVRCMGATRAPSRGIRCAGGRASSTTSNTPKSSCAGAQRAGSAQGTAPRGLHDSAAVIGCFSHQPDALMCHLRRAHPARLAAESLSNMMEERRWPAVMTPRDGGPQAAEGVASHSAADGARPSIQGARTHAHYTSRGAAAGFPASPSAMCEHPEIDLAPLKPPSCSAAIVLQ
jgi:hypothetical protein